MATLNGFTRPTDPINALDMLTKLVADTGLTITGVEITPTDVLVTGPSLVSGNQAALQSSMTNYSYSPLLYPSNSSIYADDDNTMTANSGTRLPTQRAIVSYVSGKMRKTYINGTLKNNLLDWTDSTTTSSGQAIFYITSDRTSSGTAMATNLYADSIQVNYIDNSGVYATGVPVISTDKKSITIPINKQSFTGVTLLSTNILGSVAQIAIPNGVTVKMQVLGDAA